MKAGSGSVFYRHYNLAPDFPLTVLSGDEWIALPGPVTRLHFHNCLEIGILKEGNSLLYLGENTFMFNAPAIIMVPPNTIHHTVVGDSSFCMWSWMYVDPLQLFSGFEPRFVNDVRDFLHELTGKPVILEGNEPGGVYSLMTMIESEALKAQSHYHSVIRGLFISVFAQLLRQSLTNEFAQCRRSKLMSNITPAVEYINLHFAEDVTIETLAEICHISTSHFRRLFKQVFGTAPLEYLETIRIEHACSLLYNCDYSVTEIGVMSGFPSPSSFNRQFARLYGVSPSKWRTKARSEENPAVTVYLKRTDLK